MSASIVLFALLQVASALPPCTNLCGLQAKDSINASFSKDLPSHRDFFFEDGYGVSESCSNGTNSWALNAKAFLKRLGMHDTGTNCAKTSAMSFHPTSRKNFQSLEDYFLKISRAQQLNNDFMHHLSFRGFHSVDSTYCHVLNLRGLFKFSEPGNSSSVRSWYLMPYWRIFPSDWKNDRRFRYIIQIVDANSSKIQTLALPRNSSSNCTGNPSSCGKYNQFQYVMPWPTESYSFFQEMGGSDIPAVKVVMQHMKDPFQEHRRRG